MKNIFVLFCGRDQSQCIVGYLPEARPRSTRRERIEVLSEPYSAAVKVLAVWYVLPARGEATLNPKGTIPLLYYVPPAQGEATLNPKGTD